jgi:hypothetical protein
VKTKVVPCGPLVGVTLNVAVPAEAVGTTTNSRAITLAIAKSFFILVSFHEIEEPLFRTLAFLAAHHLPSFKIIIAYTKIAFLSRGYSKF